MNLDASLDICIPSAKEISDVMRIVAKMISKSVCVIVFSKSKTVAAEPVRDFPIV